MSKKVSKPLVDLAVVRGPILNTWNDIAADAAELCDGDNEIAIEFCIDADRLTSNCREDELEKAKAADKAISEACDKYGPNKVRSFLSKNIRLL